MKKLIFLCAISATILSCSAPVKNEEVETTATAVELPYEATYSSQFTSDVSDQDLLAVLNTYKSWENGDMKSLRAAMSDTISLEAWNGYVFHGSTDEIMSKWAASRDSLSASKINMAAWIKTHSGDKKDDFILVWYKEIDTYKNGKIDSAEWHDINLVKNGKIVFYSQYKRPYKAKK